MNVLVLLATLVAAGVEWVEALTIVLAVGLFKGWRSALVGTVAAVIALTVIVSVFGLAVTAYVSISLARTIVGFFLLIFGLRWLAKAILRFAGLKATRDEAAEFEEAKAHLQAQVAPGPGRLDRAGVATSFSGVFLEGLEVVFIVIGLGGLSSLPAAITGALLGLAAVLVAGLSLRQPLTRVPENAMKFVVGVMLTTFGTFFAGEGIGVIWWHDDLALLPLLASYLAASMILVAYLRRPARAPHLRPAFLRAVTGAWSELYGLFVGDGSIAVVALAVLFGVGFWLAKVRAEAGAAAPVLVAGVVAAVVVGISGADGGRRVAGAETPSKEGIDAEASPSLEEGIT